MTEEVREHPDDSRDAAGEQIPADQPGVLIGWNRLLAGGVRDPDTLAEGHALLGLALGTCDFNWTGAEREIQRALQLDPASPDVHYLASMVFQATGRIEEAVGAMRQALELDPLSAYFNVLLGCDCSMAGRPDQGIAHGRLAIELDPNLWFAYWMLAVAYLYSGRVGEAIATAEKGIEVGGRYPFLLMCLGACYAVAGRIPEARQLLEELKTPGRETRVSPYAIGVVHLALGEVDQGLESFAGAVEGRDLPAILTLKAEPTYAPLRPHPAFQALLRKMNLAP